MPCLWLLQSDVFGDLSEHAPLHFFTIRSGSSSQPVLRLSSDKRGSNGSSPKQGETTMLGLVLGTLCLIALIATLRRRHHRLLFAHGHTGGHGHWRGPYAGFGYGQPWLGYGRGSRGGRRGGFARAFFERLDTTPGQEKAIGQALDTVREQMRGARDELSAARKSLATAIGGDVIDGAALDAALGQQKSLVDKLGQSVTQALLSVHEALDGEQRKRLAELIAQGPFGGRWGGSRF
jgi:Spy/CpxP family protein refolding chaperone